MKHSKCIDQLTHASDHRYIASVIVSLITHITISWLLALHRSSAWGYHPERYQFEGLNSLNYEVQNIEKRPLYTWVIMQCSHHYSHYILVFLEFNFI